MFISSNFKEKTAFLIFSLLIQLSFSIPCQDGEFLYPNNTCLSFCNPPYLIKISKTIPHCTHSTPSEYTDSSIPLISQSNIRTNLRHLQAETDQNSLMEMVEPPMKENTYTIFMLGKMNKYIAFLDMTLPSRLQTLASGLRNRKRILSYTFGITMPDKELADVPYHDIPDPFVVQGYHSNFFVNFMDSFISLLIMVCIGCFFVLFELIFKKLAWGISQDICASIKLLLNWNWTLVLFAMQIDDIIIYSYLEVRTLTADSAIAVVSFLLCLFMILFTIALLLGIVYIAYQAQNYQPTRAMVLRGRPFEFTREWKQFQALFGGMKNNAYTSQMFYFIYILRTSLSTLIGVVLYFAPGPQTALQLLISVLILIYVMVKRPLRSFVNFIQICIVESIYFVTNLSMVVIVCFVAKEDQEGHTAVSFGDFIIIGNIILNILPLVFLAVKLFLEGRDIYQVRKKQPDEPRTIWLQLLTVLLQQGGMGFEEVVVVGFPDIIEPSSPRRPKKFFPSKSELKDKESPLKSSFEYRPKRPSIIVDSQQTIDITRPLQALVSVRDEPTPLRIVETPAELEKSEYNYDFRILTPDRVKNRPLRKNGYGTDKLGGTGKTEMRKSLGLENGIDVNKSIEMGLGLSKLETGVVESFEVTNYDSQLMQHPDQDNNMNYSMLRRSYVRPGTGEKKSSFYSQGNLTKSRLQRPVINHLSIDTGMYHPNNTSLAGSGNFIHSPNSEGNPLVSLANRNHNEAPLRLDQLHQLQYSALSNHLTIDSPKEPFKSSGNLNSEIYEAEVNRLE